jgi:hypothetical protein
MNSINLNNDKFMYIIFMLLSLLDIVKGQFEVTFDVTLPDGSTNPYFLLLIFWIVAFMWPILRWIYSSFIERAVNQVKERVENIAHQISEKISAAGRKLSEQIKA